MWWRLCWVLCDWSFQVLGYLTMDERRIEETKLGDAPASQAIIQEWQPTKLGDAPEWHPLFLLTTIGILLETIFLFITWYVFCLERIFNFTCCLNKIIGSEFPNEKESSHGYLIIWLLSILHLYLFGVVCHLLTCFTYILWVNGWMNWIS